MKKFLLKKDTFLHFTLESRAQRIKESKKIMKNPPDIEKRGIDAVTAISLSYGQWVPRTQTNGLLNKGEKVVGIVFKTRTMPKYGYVEEVVWDKDIVIDSMKIITFKQGIDLLKKVKHPLDDQDYVEYY